MFGKIFVIFDPKFVGDKNQSLGIANAVLAQGAKAEIQVLEIGSAELDVAIEQLQESNNSILIVSAGLSGFNYLTSEIFQKRTDNVQLVWSGHQVFEEICSEEIKSKTLPDVMVFQLHVSDKIHILIIERTDFY